MRLRELPYADLNPKSLQLPRGASSQGLSTWWQNLNYLSHHLLPSELYISRKLESEGGWVWNTGTVMCDTGVSAVQMPPPRLLLHV